VDEHGAEDTKLTEGDVQRLDTLCWRSLKNQTTSRSKIGQEPRLYVRVEYADESFHLGDLSREFRVDEEHSEPDERLRSIRDVVVDVDPFVSRIAENAERIDTVHVVVSPSIRLSDGGEELTDPESLYDELGDVLGPDGVHVIDVYDEYEATLPEE
jgi:CRISPR-associated protein Csh2